jgi:hypothetical protein
MARELVTEKGVGEKADACWRELQKQHARLLESQRTRPPEVTVVTEGIAPNPEPLQKPEALVELALTRRAAARRPRYSDDAQLSLGF